MDLLFEASRRFNSRFSLVVDSCFFGFAGFCRGDLGDAFFGDTLRCGAFAGGGAGEGSVEAIDIDGAFADFALDSGMHGGQKLGSQFIQQLVDVDVGQTFLRGATVPICQKIHGQLGSSQRSRLETPAISVEEGHPIQ